MTRTKLPDLSDYASQLQAMADWEYQEECFAQVDAANQSPVYSAADARAKHCYEEGVRRERLDLYQRAFKAAYETAKGDGRYRAAFDHMTVGA